MRKSNREVNGEKVFRYSIRKYHFGAASVAVAALMFFANGAVKADALAVSPVTANTEKVNAGVTDLTEGVPLEKSLETEGNKEIVASEPAEKISNKEDGAVSNAQDAKEIKVSDKAVLTTNQIEQINKAETNIKEEEAVVNKDKLESLLKEIDQLNSKDYTEDTVKVLQEKVAKAKEVLVNAKTQKEIDLAYNELVGYKNAGLKRVPKPKGELTPKPDTTNYKETVGKKAENTDPNGTNIAGHNHSLNGTTLPEGSGFRAAPNNANFRYETDGADLSRLVAGEELGYGKKVIIKVRYDKNVISSRDINITTTPNTGPRIEYTNRSRDGIGPYDGGTNVKLVGIIPNDMIGTYDLHVHILNNKNSNSEITTLKIPITVKPKKPTVSVADLANAEGKKPVVTATVANTSISKVEFYLNGQKQTVVNATNGQATWTPTSALRENDRITVKNIAKGGIPPRDAYGNTFTISEVESDMSDAVIIPKAPKPAFDLGAEKSNAKAELGRIAQAEINAINGDNSLTATEKTAKVQEVNTKKTQGEQAIDEASVNDADKVAQAKATAKTAIEGVHTPGNLATVKSNAKAELGRIAAEEIKAIKADASLTSTEKQSKENDVNTKKTQGEQAIDDATADNADKVAQAKETAKTAIEGVHTPGNLATVKSNAKVELGRIAQSEITAINGDNSLTTTEKTAKVQEVNNKKTQGEQAIDAATTDNADKVAQAKETAKTAIEGVHTPGNLATVKSNAKAELGRIAQSEITAINGDNSLTTTEKTAKVEEVNTKKTQGEQAIDAASVNDADKVAQAKETAKTAIEGVHTPGNLETVKSNAKAELGRIAQAEITAINGDNSLTTTEKTAKVQEVNTKKTQGEQAIDAATTDNADKVAQAKETAKTAIEGVHTPGDLAEVKRQAKADLATITAEEIKAIKADASLPASEQAKKEAEVNTKKADGEQAIDAATADNADKVAQAKETAKTAIEGVHTPGDLATVKSNAKAELGRIAQAEITAINGDNSLTTTEKTAKVQEVNTKKTQGEQAIDAASVNDADKVAQAKETAKTAIEGVHTPGNLATVKSNAKAELGRIAQAEITAINGDNSLTTTEKTAKVQEVNNKKTQGEQAIDAASVNDADKVAQAKETAKTAIEGVHTPGDLAEVKRQAKAELATIAAEEIKAIKADASLPASEQAKKEAEVNTKKADGEQAIDAATADNADKVAQAKETAKTAIEGVHTPGDLATVKSNAKAELGRIAQAEITAINGDNSLTTTEKTAKVQEVNTKKTQGEQAIDAATADNADKVAQAKETAKTAIEGVHTPGDLAEVKRQAKAELATIAAEEIKAIKADASLPASEQAKKEAEVNTKKADGEQAIDAATADNADKVAQAKETAKTAIEGVHTPGDLAEVKRQAKAELATIAAEEKAEIAGDKSLTTAKRAEKEKAVDTTKAAEEAKITVADNADKVEAAKTAGVAAIKAVHTAGDLNAVKNAAKADLATAAAEEKAEIAGDKSLTAAQRAEKEKAVDTTKAAEEAKITAADDADKVEAAKIAGVTAIKAVHTAGDLNAVKNAAKADLATAAAEEKAEIAGDKSLTAAQRAEKEKAVDTTKAAEEAKITAADDADKVEAAKIAGVAAIKAVHTVGSLDDVKAAAKALPNTGTVKSTLAIPVAITSALLSLGLVGGRRRKEDEEV